MTTFQRVAGTQLFWQPSSGRTIGFLAAPDVGLDDAPTLGKTWTDPRGVYVLLRSAPDADVSFAAALREYLTSLGWPDGPRFVWLTDHAGPAASWQGQGLSLSASGTVARRVDFRFAPHALSVLGGDGVALDGDRGFVFSAAGASPAATYASRSDAWPATGGEIRLPLDGAAAGCWTLRIDVPGGTAGASPGFDALGLGIRFFTAGAGGRVAALELPTLRQPVSGGLPLFATLDPLRPLDPDRSNLAFFPAGGGPPVAALPTTLATVHGHPVTLTPQDASGAVPAAGMAFAEHPRSNGPGAVPKDLYLTPRGLFALGWDGGGSEPGGMERLLCGTSGLEYLGVPAGASAQLAFVPGRPAFAPAPGEGAPLTSLGTTAWAAVGGAGVRYFAQPEHAPLFHGPAAAVEGGPFLGFHETPAASFGASPDPAGAFPLAAYAGLPAAEVPQALALEAAAIAPARRGALRNAAAPADEVTAPGDDVAVSVTMQGLGVGITSDGSWSWLGLANSSGGAAEPDLRFDRVGATLRGALQTNRLFMVMANASVLGAAGASAEGLTARIGEWTFPMGPLHWTNPGRRGHETGLLVFKFAPGRSLRQLAADTGAWAWPEVGAPPGGTTADGSSELLRICRDIDTEHARTSAGGRASPYADVKALVDDPDWSGVIAFNVDVPLAELPEPLQALRAGLDSRRFFAHHVGFGLTPVSTEGTALRFGRTPMFGLIDYDDPEDQYFEEDVHFAFKVLRLTVGFRNSAVASFSSRVELMVNRLFGAETTVTPTEAGNNVVLDGVLQHQPGPGGADRGAYVFSVARDTTMELDASALRAVTLRSGQLTTVRGIDPSRPQQPVLARFSLGGDMRFHEHVPFDAFSFDALRFSNLTVTMSFPPVDRPAVTFTPSLDGIAFDPATSARRPASLYARFPLTLTGLVGTPDPRATDPKAAPADSKRGPETLGYVSAGAPLQQARLQDPWFGLVHEVDLGTLGALAGDAGLKLKLLLAWSGGGTDAEPAVFVGVRLPGVKDAVGFEMPLQGVLSLGFRSIGFLVQGEGDKRAYLLRLRNFALRFLGLAFPPGHNDVLLFGNPDATSDTKLGWYAAYAAGADPKKAKLASPQTRLLARRPGDGT